MRSTSSTSIPTRCRVSASACRWCSGDRRRDVRDARATSARRSRCCWPKDCASPSATSTRRSTARSTARCWCCHHLHAKGILGAALDALRARTARPIAPEAAAVCRAHSAAARAPSRAASSAPADRRPAVRCGRRDIGEGAPASGVHLLAPQRTSCSRRAGARARAAAAIDSALSRRVAALAE